MLLMVLLLLLLLLGYHWVESSTHSDCTWTMKIGNQRIFQDLIVALGVYFLLQQRYCTHALFKKKTQKKPEAQQVGSTFDFLLLRQMTINGIVMVGVRIA